MTTSSFIFAAYLFFAIYCAGSMTVLQMQHFALYPKVGQENFVQYIQANNRAAFIPAILPALLLLISTVALLFVRPSYMPMSFAVTSVTLNLVNIISTAIWQGRIHGQLEKVGFNEELINQLVNTNWIRTVALLTQALIALYCVTYTLNHYNK
jgi:hypothetical protein